MVLLAGILGVGALFGVLGGVICASRAVKAGRGFAAVYGLFLAALTVALVTLAVVAGDGASGTGAAEAVLLLFGFGATFGGLLAGALYALAYFLGKGAARPGAG